MEVLTYVPQTVGLMISGWQVEGWTEISVSRNTPGFTQIRGIRGKNTRTRNKSTAVTITIKTLQTELCNEVLSFIHDIDLAQGTCRLEIAIAEGSGTSFFSSTTGYILGYPELNYTDDVGEVAWTIVCDESNMHLGAAKKVAAGVVQNGISQLKNFVSTASDVVSSVF